MRISHEVSSSQSTSEFITTSRVMRAAWRAANDSAGWPPMSMPTMVARSICQASSSRSRRSAMWPGVLPPGQGSLKPMPGQSKAMTAKRSASRGATSHQIWRFSG